MTSLHCICITVICALAREKAQIMDASAAIQEFPTYFLSSTKAAEGEEQFLGNTLALLPVRSRHFLVHIRDGDVVTRCMHVSITFYPKKKKEGREVNRGY